MDSSKVCLKYAGISVATGAAIGLFLYISRQDNRHLIEIERLQFMVEKLKDQCSEMQETLSKIEDELRNPRLIRTPSNGILKNVTFKIEQQPRASSSVSTISPSKFERKSALVRNRSYCSITSDSEYENAEEDWFDDLGRGATSPAKQVLNP